MSEKKETFGSRFLQQEGGLEPGTVRDLQTISKASEGDDDSKITPAKVLAAAAANIDNSVPVAIVGALVGGVGGVVGAESKYPVPNLATISPAYKETPEDIAKIEIDSNPNSKSWEPKKVISEYENAKGKIIKEREAARKDAVRPHYEALDNKLNFVFDTLTGGLITGAAVPPAVGVAGLVINSRRRRKDEQEKAEPRKDSYPRLG